MLDLKRSQAWSGSLTFTVAVTAFFFLFFWAFGVAGMPLNNIAAIAAVSVGLALALEAIRLRWIGRLRKEAARADSRAVVKVSLNGVEVGEIPSPCSPP